MQILEKKRVEIEARANTMSDFLKMEYLESCLKNNIEIDAQKYSYGELSNLYEKKMMYTEAIKHISNFRELCTGSKEKIEAYLKETELLIKAEMYSEANYNYRRAFEIATESEKYEIKRKVVEFYKKQIEYFERTSRNAHLLKIYEVLLFLVTDAEKTEIKRKILNLYKRLGKVKESLKLEEELSREMPKEELI